MTLGCTVRKNVSQGSFLCLLRRPWGGIFLANSVQPFAVFGGDAVDFIHAQTTEFG
jgi:hypothetical protein